MTKKKLGPPTKAPGERLRNRIMLNLRDSEIEQLEHLAGDESVASYARDVVLRHLKAKGRQR